MATVDPRDTDLPLEEAQAMIQGLVEKIPGLIAYFKWTCERCGDRVVFDQPHVIYIHAIHTEREDGSECGHQTEVERVGVRLIFPREVLANPEAVRIIRQARSMAALAAMKIDQTH